MLFIFILLNHCIVWNKPKVSPTSVEYTPAKLTILARTKIPSSSRRQIPTLVRLWGVEKVASMLHFNLLLVGVCQLIWWSATVTKGAGTTTELAPASDCCCNPSGDGYIDVRRPFASSQSSSRTLARSITIAHVSVTSSQTFKLRCFHKIHKIKPNIWPAH